MTSEEVSLKITVRTSSLRAYGLSVFAQFLSEYILHFWFLRGVPLSLVIIKLQYVPAEVNQISKQLYWEITPTLNYLGEV